MVALKVTKLGMDTRAERLALAMMDHPNISKVFDAGATESGRPYFVMELVKGIPAWDCHLTFADWSQRVRSRIDESPKPQASLAPSRAIVVVAVAGVLVEHAHVRATGTPCI